LNAPAKPLTHFNDAIAKKRQGKREALSWKSTDGFTPNGIVTYPPDFDPQKKYPLALYIHGGPTASSLLSFSAVPQIMAGKGWIVFQPNYRGSNNLGNAFQSAIANDAAEGPGEDVMSGVQFLIEKGFVDTEKMVVSGWSYGGWMTSWMIGRYPDVWAAAVAGAAPVDYTDMYSLSDLNRMRRHAITGSPYTGDNLMKAYEQSPIIHFSKLKTPTLIMSKTGDYRVSITGSYKLYGALRDNNIPVEFIAYPGPGHFPRDPVRSLDVYTRWINWFQKYIGKKLP
jgi:dipeptidyl aminopeptidase/acylaminoacyl peptidase